MTHQGPTLAVLAEPEQVGEQLQPDIETLQAVELRPLEQLRRLAMVAQRRSPVAVGRDTVHPGLARAAPEQRADLRGEVARPPRRLERAREMLLGFAAVPEVQRHPAALPLVALAHLRRHVLHRQLVAHPVEQRRHVLRALDHRQRLPLLEQGERHRLVRRAVAAEQRGALLMDVDDAAEVAEPVPDLRDRVEHIGLQHRVAGQPIDELLLVGREQLPYRDITPAMQCGVGVVEDAHHEVARGVGAPRLFAGDAGLLHRHQGRHHHRRHAGGDAARDQAVADQELAQTDPGRRRPGLHGAAGRPATQVVVQGERRAVTLTRVTGQRTQHDRIEIALQLACEAPRRRVAGEGDHLAHLHAARCAHLALEDGMLVFGHRAALDRVGRPAAQQLVQHHPERIHIGTDAEPLPLHLLRARVARRQGAGRGLCRLILAPEDRFGDQRRDAEIQQLRLALGVDQHIGGLEVAVHDERGVRVLHRLQDLHEERHPRPGIETLLVAVPVEVDALDILDGEERSTSLVDAGVVEPRDVGMVERTEDVPLALHARRQALRPGELRQLEGQFALELAVGALSQPDRALAAAADAIEDPVGADLVARLQVGGRLGHPRQGVEEGLRLDARLRRQQPAQRALQAMVLGGEAVEPGLTLGRIEGQRLVEEPVDDRPLRRKVGKQFQG